MYGVSARFLEALRAPHTAIFSVDAWHGSTLVASNLPISGGSVSIDSTSDVRRSCSVEIPDRSLGPALDGTGVVTPYATTLRVQRGIRYVDGTTETVPLGRFRVNDVKTSTSGGLSVTATDSTRTLQEDGFVTPENSVTTSPVPYEIRRVARLTLPSVGFIDLTGSGAGPPALVYEGSRWDAIKTLGDGIGAVSYFDALDRLVVGYLPSISNNVVWHADAGELGVLVEAEAQISRERVYNGVVVTGERTDNSTPVIGTAYDLDDASPTKWGGNFGRNLYRFSSPILTTTSAATAAAETVLARTRGLFRQLRLSAVPNPALDVGDVVLVRWLDGTAEKHVVDKITIPLDVGSAMSLDTRSGAPELE